MHCLIFPPSGAKCEIDIDECDSTPCQNGGLCKDGMGDFQCQCKPGFLGRGAFRNLWVFNSHKSLEYKRNEQYETMENQHNYFQILGGLENDDLQATFYVGIRPALFYIHWIILNPTCFLATINLSLFCQVKTKLWCAKKNSCGLPVGFYMVLVFPGCLSP